MYFWHQNFYLDQKRKRVFDENNKELRITGNAYRLLVFLCEKGAANLTEIGDYLDYAKEYNENHLRQYRYRVNLVIGRDVIEYRNGVYALVGEVEAGEEFPERFRNKLDKVESDSKSDRNTDLLHKNSLKSELKEPKKVAKKVADAKLTNAKPMKKVSFTIYPAIAASIVLILTVFDWPGGYYTFLRIVVTGVAVYYGYYLYAIEKYWGFWFWALVLVAIVFNPIFPVYLYEKKLWLPIDVGTVVLLLGFGVRTRRLLEKNKE